MPVCNLSDLPALLPKESCLLGLDPGSKVLGVAISDPGLKIASPLTGIRRTKFAADAAALAEIIRERNIGGLIIGLPRELEGAEGKAAQSARAFASNLLRWKGLPLADPPIVMWDERFSTAAVTRFMLADDMTRRRRAAIVDKTAAAYILQGALDAIINADFIGA